MDNIKKIITMAVVAFAMIIFTETVYGQEKGRLIYYKKDEVVEEDVLFNSNNTERNALLLLKVLLQAKCESVPDSIEIKYTFLDEGELIVCVNDVFEDIKEHEKGLITEQITKTACSLKGVESIMIYVEK